MTNNEPMLPSALDDDRLRALLREDAPLGDLTTQALDLNEVPAHIRYEARGAMVVSALALAQRLLALVGVSAQAHVADGDAVSPGTLLLEGHGRASAVLLAWKVSQTLMESASGVATATAAILQRVREAGFDIPLACTRKAPPGTRWWSAQAVRDGGGVMHRLGLSETLLVFPEHRALLSGEHLRDRVLRLRRQQPEKRLVLEVGDAEEALVWARAGVDVLQLERMSPAALQALRQQLQAENLPTLMAPAGGVNLDNAVAYAQAGADLLVSSAPYFAKPADVKVHITPETRPVA